MPPLHFYDNETRPWSNRRLKSASILGHVTTTSIRLWLRAEVPGKYVLVVSRNPIDGSVVPLGTRGDPPVAFGQAHLGGETPIGERAYDVPLTFATDITAVVDVEGLEPDTTYHYALFRPDAQETKRWTLGYQETLTFRTHAEKLDHVTFGLFSCHMPFNDRDLVHMHMFDHLLSELTASEARFVIGAGDQVYVDGNPYVDIWRWLRKVKERGPTPDDMVSWYRDIYRGYWGPPSIRALFRSFPTYMIWDDHEIMDGWGSFTAKELSNKLDTIWEWENEKDNLRLAHEMFGAAKRVYSEYQHSHNPRTPADQWDYHFSAGPVGFYVLDMRGHRDYNAADGQRVLGLAQMQRLHDWFATTDAQVAVIVSPVPVVHASSFVVNSFDLPLLGIADDLRDEWEHETNWTERDTLLLSLFTWSEQRRRKVILLSGDVHVSGAFKLFHRSFPNASVHQFTSSGITYAGLSRLARRGWELAVSSHGTLGYHEKVPDEHRVHFRTLHTNSRNHFAIVRIDTRPTRDGGASKLAPPVVTFDVYASTDGAGITKLERVRI